MKMAGFEKTWGRGIILKTNTQIIIKVFKKHIKESKTIIEPYR